MTLATIWDTTIWDWLSDGVRDAIDGIETWVGSFSAVDFILAVVVIWALYWIWSALRASTRLGPIELTELTAVTEPAKSEANALTGLLRERLARTGLVPPPAVPAGTPQTNLIAAVETSGHPQAEWIGKALALVPHPPRSPEYKLSGTLLKSRGPRSEGLRYWLQPKYTGKSQTETVMREGRDDPYALRRAATDIFLGISRDAPHVFPQWAQWENPEAFEEYIAGIEHRLRDQDGNDAKAEKDFEAAVRMERSNLLPRLELANLLERRYSADKRKTDADGSELDAEERERILDRAGVLRRYLNIAVARPELVPARYRASIMAGMLATTCEVQQDLLDEELEREIRGTVGLADETGLADALHDLGAAESKSAYQLVGRFYVLLAQRRLRHRYEPTGVERRELRRTIAISRHALRLRRLGMDTSREARRQVALSRALVRWLHLGLLRASAGWNAHYNAGCFYALLHNRELKVGGSAQSPAATAKGLAGRGHQPKLRTLKRRAYEELELAIDLSNGELPAEWLSEGDRDLDSLRRKDDPEWRLLERRASGTEDPEDLPLPQPAWGDPHRRSAEWAGLALLLFWLAIAVLVLFLPVVVVGVSAVVIAVVAGYIAVQVGRRDVVLVAGVTVLTLGIAAVLLLVLPLWVIVAALLFFAGVLSVVAWRRLATKARKRDEENEKRKSKDEQANKGQPGAGTREEAGTTGG